MRKLKALLSGSFARQVMVLVGGTAFAQGLGVVAMPLLTRLYSPADFGTLALFSALLGMISVVASLRYQIAIPLPEQDYQAANLLALALICLVCVTVLTTGASLLFPDQIAGLMKAPALVGYLWLLPIAVVATGAYGIFQYWATRKKAFAHIARTRVEQSIGGVGLQFAMGLKNASALGLIVGQIVSNGAGVWGLARRAYRFDREVLQQINYNDIKAVAREYIRFPKYSALEALTNTAGIQLPIILISSLSSQAEVGYLMLAMKLMQIPMTLIGTSVSQVYFSRAVDESREGRLGVFTAKVIGQLAKVGIGPLIFIGMVSPTFFAYVFGVQWGRSGELVAWMTPWFVLQFLASPVSMSLHITSHQRTALILTMFGLLLRVGFLYAGVKFLNLDAAENYAVSGFIFYFICLWVFCGISGVSIWSLLNELKKSLPIIGFSIVLAVSVKIIFLMLYLHNYEGLHNIINSTNQCMQFINEQFNKLLRIVETAQELV